jgi:nicotinate-nucleotide pyrophosphorylase (carboxylating)
VKNTEEFLIANNANIVDRILVDNFTPTAIKSLIDQHICIKPIEASGGITEQNILEYAQSGVNYVSLGDLTHHVQSVDISLKIV